jgi:hypothetical protein
MKIVNCKHETESGRACQWLIPIVRALAKMTDERIKIIRDALLSTCTIFLTKDWPQNPANMEMQIR